MSFLSPEVFLKNYFFNLQMSIEIPFLDSRSLQINQKPLKNPRFFIYSISVEIQLVWCVIFEIAQKYAIKNHLNSLSSKNLYILFAIFYKNSFSKFFLPNLHSTIFKQPSFHLFPTEKSIYFLQGRENYTNVFLVKVIFALMTFSI